MHPWQKQTVLIRTDTHQGTMPNTLHVDGDMKIKVTG